jgi:hypothetical protein
MFHFHVIANMAAKWAGIWTAHIVKEPALNQRLFPAFPEQILHYNQ